MSNYIFWPVKFNGIEGHITLKYLGDVDVPLQKAIAALCVFKNHYPTFHSMTREVFEFAGVSHYVLELKATNSLIQEMHNALNFRPDDFLVFRPHITLPKWSWENLEGVNFNDLDFFIGTLRYYYNGVEYKFIQNQIEGV